MTVAQLIELLSVYPFQEGEIKIALHNDKVLKIDEIISCHDSKGTAILFAVDKTISEITLEENSNVVHMH